MYDTHCHLDDVGYTDIDEVLKNAISNGVDRFIIPAADPKDLPKARDLSYRYKNVYFAVGVHPNHAHEYDEELLLQYISDERCVAVGECGLDYFRLKKSDAQSIKQCQKDVFVSQIKLAKRFDLPLILHIREASSDVLEILRSFDYNSLRGVLHCFNADSMLLELSKTFYYGIGGVLTFKNARRLVDILPQIPQNRLLLETDSPYLSPEPYRGKRNSPEYIPIIASKMAELLNQSPQYISQLTDTNANNLFWAKEMPNGTRNC